MSGQGYERPDEIIEHGPVTLRRYRADDLDALFSAVTESLVHLLAWLSWAAGYTRQTAAEYLEKSIRSWADGTEYNYAIVTEGVLVGGIGLMTRSGPGSLEIGYWVHRAYTRRGLATAAAAALVEQAFRLPGVDWVEIVHEELNVASGKIPRKLGFTEIGHRALDHPAQAGNGTGIVWRLPKPQGPNGVT
jgi:RimJ/RimL family protein N-acetyltransferase